MVQWLLFLRSESNFYGCLLIYSLYRGMVSRTHFHAGACERFINTLRPVIVPQSLTVCVAANKFPEKGGKFEWYLHNG